MSFVAWMAALRRCIFSCAVVVLGTVAAGESARAEDPIKLAVFPFELEDFSAAGGVVSTEGRDAKYLAEATEEGKRRLAESGRYTIVETTNAQDEAVRTHTLHSCNGCVGPIIKKLGADQAVIGTVTRIGRTEYTLLVQVFDGTSGEPAARYFTGLRLGADYSWPRAVRWLMKHRMLAKNGG